MNAVHKAVEEFIAEQTEYMPAEIEVLKKEPKSHDFLREYVHKSLPFIITPTPLYFRETAHEFKFQHKLMEFMKLKKVNISLTPEGRSDIVYDDKFMVPETQHLYFTEYVKEYFQPKENRCVYIKKEENNLFTDFYPILPYLKQHVPWATEAFAKAPAAANFFMGNKGSFSSMHQDEHENIYYVVRGEKMFTIYPPLAKIWMPYRKYPKFQWYQELYNESMVWQKLDLKEEVTMITTNLLPLNPWRRELMERTKSYTVTVKSGQAFYLPALWYHDVSQSDGTIAVNFRYDTTFENKYPYYNFMNKIAYLEFPNCDAAVDIQLDLEDGLLDDLFPIQKGKEIVRPSRSQRKF